MTLQESVENRQEGCFVVQKKTSWFKSGYFWGIVLLALGFVLKPSAGMSPAGPIGMLIIIVTAIKRSRAKKKNSVTASDINKATPNQNGSSVSVVSQTPAPSIPNVPDSSTTQPSTSAYKIETHKVAGVSYRQDAIKSLGHYNDDYDMSKRDIEDIYGTDVRVYQYEFSPSNVQLVPEYSDKYEGLGIRVEVDGVHIGYIKHGSTTHVKKLIDNNLIHSISAEISGGKSKIVLEEEDDDGNIKTKLERSSSDFGFYAKLTFEVIQENK